MKVTYTEHPHQPESNTNLTGNWGKDKSTDRILKRVIKTRTGEGTGTFWTCVSVYRQENPRGKKVLRDTVK